MEAMRESWTDERLDDFRGEVNRRFDAARDETNRRFDEAATETNRRFDEAATENNRRFDEVHRELRVQRAETSDRFGRVEARLDDLNRTLVRFGFGAIVTFIVGFTGMIATQL